MESADIDHLLITLLSSRSDIVRGNVLVFLQQNAATLLGADSEALDKLVRSSTQLLSSTAASYLLRGHVLVTLTTIFIVLDAAESRPTLLSYFIGYLWRIASEPNQSENRLFRQCAVESLRELELCYPCLLEELVMDIMGEQSTVPAGAHTLQQCVQLERTHVAESYLLLFSTILEHVCVLECRTTSKARGTGLPSISKSGTAESSPSITMLVTGKGSERVIHLASASTEEADVTQVKAATTAQEAYPVTVVLPTPRISLLHTTKNTHGATSSELSPANTLRDTSEAGTANTEINEVFPSDWVDHTGEFHNLKLRLLLEPGRPRSFEPALQCHFPAVMRCVDENWLLRRLRPATRVKRVTKALSLSLDMLPLLSRWGRALIVAKLIHFAEIVDLPSSVFRHHFFGMLFSRSALLHHVVLMMHAANALHTKNRPVGVDKLALNEDDEAALLEHLLEQVCDPTFPAGTRALMLQWILLFPANDERQQSRKQRRIDGGHKNNQKTHFDATDGLPRLSKPTSPAFELLHSNHCTLHPTPFDGLDMRAHKLHALILCMDPQPGSPCSPGPNFLSILRDAFEEFYIIEPPPFIAAEIALSVLRESLHRFPFLCAQAREFLFDLMLKSPQFNSLIVVTIDAFILDDIRAGHDVKCGAYMERSMLRCDKVVAANTECRKAVALWLLRSLANLLSDFARVPPDTLPQHFFLLQRIGREVLIDPGPLFTALLQFAQTEKVRGSSDWNSGSQLLDCCRVLMIHHPHRVISEPCKKILHFIVTHYKDVDVVDRARLYLRLVTHVSDTTLKQILNGDDAKDDCLFEFAPRPRISLRLIAGICNVILLKPCTDARREVGLLDCGSADVRSALKEAENEAYKIRPSPSSHDASTDSALPPFQILSPDVVTLGGALWQRGGDDIKLAPGFSYATAPPPQDILSSYLDIVAKSRSTCSGGEKKAGDRGCVPRRIHLPLRLDFAAQPEGGYEVACPGAPERLYAVVLEFSPSHFYRPVPQVRLPYLVAKNTRTIEENIVDVQANADDEAAFPFAYKLMLPLEPLKPVPAVFQVRAVWNNEYGVGCEGALADVVVAFEDLLLPLPVSSAFPHSVSGSAESALRRSLFSKLWGVLGVHSVRHLKLSRLQMLQEVAKRCAPFVVGRQEALIEIGTFLPPAHHLLFVINIGEVDSSIQLRCDSYELLGWCDHFFEQWVEDGQSENLPPSAPAHPSPSLMILPRQRQRSGSDNSLLVMI